MRPETERLFRPEIATLHAYTPGEQPRGRDIIKLNTNENPYPPSPAVAAALQGLDWQRLNRYPDPGATVVREAAAAAYGLRPDEVLAGNGSDELLTMITRCFAGAGRAVAYCEPSYSLYPVLARIQGAPERAIALTDDFGLPADAAAQLAGAGLCFLARPNAPVGNCFPLDQVRRLADAFAGVLVVDEAYADFAADNAIALIRECPRLIVLRTLSKSYSLAGVRLGLALAQAELLAGVAKVKDSYNVNQLTQQVAAAALRDQDYMRTYVSCIQVTRAHVAAALTQLGWQVVPSQANFLFARPPLPAADAMARLRAANIIVRYFPAPRTAAYLRITIGTDAEMDAFLQHVAAW